MRLSMQELDKKITMLEGQLKRINNKNEYYIEKEFLVDGKHAGWITMIPGIGGDDDWALIVGDEEKALDGPLTKKEMKVLNSKPGIGREEFPEADLSQHKPPAVKAFDENQKIESEEEHLRKVAQTRLDILEEFGCNHYETLF